MPMETQSYLKTNESQRYLSEFFQVRLAMSMILKTESSKVLDNPEKNKFGADFGP